jgi:hypothetical protein
VKWEAWLLAALMAINVLAVIAKVGEPREPLTKRDAVLITIGDGFLIWITIRLGVA